MMHGTSARTLVLLLELFVAVVALQYLAAIRPVRTGVVWLADDCATGISAPSDAIGDSVNT